MLIRRLRLRYRHRLRLSLRLKIRLRLTLKLRLSLRILLRVRLRLRFRLRHKIRLRLRRTLRLRFTLRLLNFVLLQLFEKTAEKKWQRTNCSMENILSDNFPKNVVFRWLDSTKQYFKSVKIIEESENWLESGLRNARLQKVERCLLISGDTVPTEMNLIQVRNR